ncbi:MULTISPECIES: hypothetical protein [Streptomyces]|uniref:hypothetical protein n=1 Tax=Streptomyces TaxID=1883 RepID=UPI00345BF9EE
MKRTALRAAGVSVLIAAAASAAVPTTAAVASSPVPGKASTPTVTAAAKAPSVNVKKILTGQGTVPSVIVSFGYVCSTATQRLDVTVTSFPPFPADATYLKATKAREDLRCDGAQHTDFVEWTHQTIDRSTPARAALSLYDKSGELQVPMAEKTMKPESGTPPIG